MQHLRGFKHFDIVPQSFVLPVEYRDLVTAHNKTRGPWIVKPAASSRGRGIFIVTSVKFILQKFKYFIKRHNNNNYIYKINIHSPFSLTKFPLMNLFWFRNMSQILCA